LILLQPSVDHFSGEMDHAGPLSKHNVVPVKSFVFSRLSASGPHGPLFPTREKPCTREKSRLGNLPLTTVPGVFSSRSASVICRKVVHVVQFVLTRLVSSVCAGPQVFVDVVHVVHDRCPAVCVRPWGTERPVLCLKLSIRAGKATASTSVPTGGLACPVPRHEAERDRPRASLDEIAQRGGMDRQTASRAVGKLAARKMLLSTWPRAIEPRSTRSSNGRMIATLSGLFGIPARS
jgi:hypothetical protein